jgi:hypothetical protein
MDTAFKPQPPQTAATLPNVLVDMSHAFEPLTERRGQAPTSTLGDRIQEAIGLSIPLYSSAL